MTEHNIHWQKVLNEALVAFHALDRATCLVQSGTGESSMGDTIESLDGDAYEAMVGLTNAMSYLDNGTLFELERLVEESQ